MFLTSVRRTEVIFAYGVTMKVVYAVLFCFIVLTGVLREEDALKMLKCNIYTRPTDIM